MVRLLCHIMRVIGLATVCIPFAQSQEPVFAYQVILETKGEYSDRDRHSSVNPDNWMQLNEFSLVSHLYPIFSFKQEWGKVRTTLQVEGDIRNDNLGKEQTSFLFQELYTQFAWQDKHYLSIGKKRLDWGTGLVWNPTNFYIQKDPMRTQNRLEGLFMVDYTYLIGNCSLDGYLFPQQQADNWSYALKATYAGHRIDGSLSVVSYRGRWQFGYDLTYGGDRFTAYSEGVLRNFTKSYRIDEAGGLIIPEAREKIFAPEIVVGGNILLSDRFSFCGEYRYRGDYPDGNLIDRYQGLLPSHSVMFDPISIGQHTLFGSLTCKDLYERWNVSLRTFVDPVSNQCLLSPLVVITFSNFQVEVSAQFYTNAFAVYDCQTTLLISCFF